MFCVHILKFDSSASCFIQSRTLGLAVDHQGGIGDQQTIFLGERSTEKCLHVFDYCDHTLGCSGSPKEKGSLCEEGN